ncbi:hypothetical protein [Streptomyces bambusae]|uniref:hypothetical protein n=1 Tax=Streptomyces bambusae TaxID=1550616 RepID=UPI001CA5A37C|nr:hypothetical protein [Streptomyces bambusae]
MPKNPPESMLHRLRQRMSRCARERWPHVDAVTVRFRAGFAYVAAELPDGHSLPLCRLHFTGVLHTWGFALYLAGNDSCKDNVLPSGPPAGSPEEALDCAGAQPCPVRLISPGDPIMKSLPPLPPQVAWHDTGTGVFPYAARVGEHWWVLRLNDFPEHPLYTLFIDAQVIGDVEDDPATWQQLPSPATLPTLTAPERAEVLHLMAGLGPYGAEAGTPCAGDWCTCSILTDEYAARPSSPPRTSAE